ncbi:MAG: acyl-CoA dehydrogenase family protein [Rubrobacteraceae bacterium]
MKTTGRPDEKVYLRRDYLEATLDRISAEASERDSDPSFPTEAFRELSVAGVLGLPVPDPVEEGGRGASFAEEWFALRAVSRADGSVGRILDGHLNGVERVAALAPEPLRSGELGAVAAGELLMGVWGADPIPGEGEPARLVDTSDGPVLEGVKTFCSGSTGLDRALVLVRAPEGARPGPPLLAYVDLGEGVEVNESWFRGYGMRSSQSHKIIFHQTPVLAVLGEPGELLREPYFSRDAIRTAATWAGVADRAIDSALSTLAAKSGSEPDDIVSLAAGKMLAARSTMNRWFEYAARRADADPSASLASFSIHMRQSIAAGCREILDEAARACGSRPFATADDLDRAKRDLDLFLLQHRLEPALARAGRQSILERGKQ